VWVKQHFVLGHSDYHYQHEGVLYGWRAGKQRPWYGGRDQTTLIRDEEPELAKMDRRTLEEYARAIRGELLTDVRRVDRPSRSAEHPTMKPPALIAPMLRNSTRKRELVVDPFAGSGSTMVAAHATERRSALIEIDPRYADVIIRRWENLSGASVARPRRRKTT
jgi:DNA modification methylase